MGIDVLDQLRMYLGMTEPSRIAYRSCFIYFSMRMFCQGYYWNDGMESHHKTIYGIDHGKIYSPEESLASFRGKM
jgi:hypothetical protein